MKRRLGFVSNSSSASFIVNILHYPNTFSLAKCIIKVRDDKNQDFGRFSTFYRELKDIEKLENLEKDGVDPNSPVVFQSCNFDTYIFQKGDEYYIKSCNNHSYWEDVSHLEFISGFEEDEEKLDEIYDETQKIKKWVDIR